MPQRALMQAAEWWGTAKTSFLFHARGIEHHSNGVQNSLGTINLVLGVRPDRQAEERLRHHRRPGQRPGRPRARTEVRSAPRLARHQQPRAPPLHRRRVGHRGTGTARAGRRRLRAVPQDRSRRDQGPAVDLLQPQGVAARQRLRHALPREAGVLQPPSTSSSTTPPGTPTSCCPAACTRKTKGRSRRSRGASSRSTRPSTARARRARTGASSRTSRRRSAGRTGSRSPARARSSRSCASPARAASPTTPA